jgi:hypothetical protein
MHITNLQIVLVLFAVYGVVCYWLGYRRGTARQVRS